MMAVAKVMFLIGERRAKKSIQNEFVVDEIIAEANQIIKCRDLLLRNSKKGEKYDQLIKYLKMNELISHYASLDVGCLDLQPMHMNLKKSESDSDLLDNHKFVEQLEEAPASLIKLLIRTNDNAKRLYAIKHPIKSRLYDLYMHLRSLWFGFIYIVLRWLLECLKQTSDGRKLENAAQLQKHLDESKRKRDVPIFPIRDSLTLAHNA